jgi:Tol biopolymer transport system component
MPVVATGKEPPACSFPLAQTRIMVSQSETYTFSKPQVVLTVKQPIHVYQWLPDNQRALIGEETNPGESVAIFNTQTGKIQVFGSRGSASDGPPAWVTSLNAVIYPRTAVTGSQLMISRGDPANIQLLDELKSTSNTPRFFAGVKPDGSQLIYLGGSDKQLHNRNISQGALGAVQSHPFDISQWTYRNPAPVFRMAWRPGSTQVFLYSNEFGNYTFLLDVNTGQVCELNLFGKEDPNDWRKSWVMTGHWSPNGRFLAVVRTKGGLPIDFSDLLVLDTVTGKLYQTDATKFGPSDLDPQGKHFISDVAWAPDNQHLAVIGRVDPSSGGKSTSAIDKLFLLDLLTGKSVQVSSAELGPNIETNLLWSSDGSKLIAKCPSGLCLLSVQKSVQP